MPFELKDTGESYEQFLKRSRKQERMAKECLPENRRIRRIWKMENELMDLMADPDHEYLGYMNSWTDKEFDRFKGMLNDGHEFNTITEGRGVKVRYSMTAKVIFRLDSGD